jgi:phosphopantothenoylcysteine decarboxylase/phosphopantothenate--cysteine ligase
VMEKVSGCAAVVMAAAVADFTPHEMSEQKVKRKGKDSMILELKATADILKELEKHKETGQIMVGFAAETADLRDKAKAKLNEKKVDLLIANDVSREDSGFDSDFNRAILLFKDGREMELDLMPKRELARCIWDAVLGLMDS